MDRARESLKTSLDARDSKKSKENDKDILLELNVLRNIYVCVFALLNVWQNLEKI